VGGNINTIGGNVNEGMNEEDCRLPECVLFPAGGGAGSVSRKRLRQRVSKKEIWAHEREGAVLGQLLT